MSRNQQHFQCIQCGEILPEKHRHNNRPVCLACAKEIGLFATGPPPRSARQARPNPTPPRTQTPRKDTPVTIKKRVSFLATKTNSGQTIISYLLTAWVVLSIIIILLGFMSAPGGKDLPSVRVSLESDNWLERGRFLAADSTRMKEFNRVTREAKKDIPEAQYWLGCYFFENSEKPSDLQFASQWFQKAAEQGSAEAQYNLALFYYKGTGVKKDIGSAKKWLRKSEQHGHLAAGKNLKYIDKIYN